jgi:hypothetical protein
MSSAVRSSVGGLRLAAVVVLALATAALEAGFLTRLFEADRFFSHLATRERLASLWYEQAMYYSYYARSVAAMEPTASAPQWPQLQAALRTLERDDRIEHPATVNALERFNVWPEVVLAGLFQLSKLHAHAQGQPLDIRCFEVQRQAPLPPIRSCTGQHVPEDFYIRSVFVLHGCGVAALVVLAYLLGDSLLAALLVPLGVAFNHNEMTRAMWGPPLRENLGMPFLLWQHVFVVAFLRGSTAAAAALATATAPAAALTPTKAPALTPTKAPAPQSEAAAPRCPRVLPALQLLAIGACTVGSLLAWQFSAFALFTQASALMAAALLGLVSPLVMQRLLWTQVGAWPLSSRPAGPVSAGP